MPAFAAVLLLTLIVGIVAGAAVSAWAAFGWIDRHCCETCRRQLRTPGGWGDLG